MYFIQIHKTVSFYHFNTLFVPPVNYFVANKNIVYLLLTKEKHLESVKWVRKEKCVFKSDTTLERWHVSELSKYLVHKMEADTKKLKAEQSRYLSSGLAVESMGHTALPGQVQGNNLLITQVTHSGSSKLKFGLRQRKMILDIQNGKDILILPCRYWTF